MRITIEDCRRLAAKRGGRCLSEVYVCTKTQMMWECKYQHQWRTVFGTIKYKKSWCPTCGYKKLSNINRIDGLKLAKKIAKSHNGKCLSTTYTSMHKKLEWVCEKGHKFKKRLAKVYHRKQWCPHCCRRPPLSIDDCRREAIKRGGWCLSDKYTNCEMPLEWVCEIGHKWRAKLRSIRINKTWCPICMSRGQTQELLRKKLEDILKAKAEANYRGFSWLRNPQTNKRLEIDIWFKDLKLAIEYDGRQHFRPIDFFGGAEAFRKTQHRDKIKNKLIKNHSDVKYFIRFCYNDELSDFKIKNKLRSIGILL